MAVLFTPIVVWYLVFVIGCLLLLHDLKQQGFSQKSGDPPDVPRA